MSISLPISFLFQEEKVDKIHKKHTGSQDRFHSTNVVIYHVCLSPRKLPCSLPFAFFNYAVDSWPPDVTRHPTIHRHCMW